MRILAIGDVTGRGGVSLLCDKLWQFRRENKIDFCVVNAENAAFITGASGEIAEQLLAAGADCLTGGNHTLRNRGAHGYLEDSTAMLRPINFPAETPGSGYTILDCQGWRMMVINAMGNVHIEPCLDNPYGYIDRALAREAGRYDFAILDIHAEATGEKLAIGYAYDGKINVIFGTHTHVPTADDMILPRGTGYVTDLGMCGESGGVLGMEPSGVVEKMRTRVGDRFTPALGAPEADGVIFTLDTSSGRVTATERVKIR